MTLDRNRLLVGFLLAYSLYFGLFLSEFASSWPTIGYNLAFTLLAPGTLLTLMLRLRGTQAIERLVHSLGLGVAFLITLGLVLTFLPLPPGSDGPLSRSTTGAAFAISLLILALVAYFRNPSFVARASFPRPSLLDAAFVLLPLLFLALGVSGAVSLNNGQSGRSSSLVALGGIGGYLLVLTALKRYLRPYVYPYTLLMVALTILLMTSLRGWLTSGHDVQREFYLFQTTKLLGHWSPPQLVDAYNSCLSITVLPTVLASLTAVEDHYVYKLVFQVIFSFSVLSVYALWSRYVGRDTAFLCAIWYVSFPTFINDLPMLNRQEIAFFFFALMLLTVFSPNTPKHERTVLFGVYGFGMAVSHYSTAYVAVALVALTLALSVCVQIWQSRIGLGPLRKWWSRAGVEPQARNWTVVGTSVTMVLLLVLQVLTWNVLVTRSADHLAAVLQSVVTRMDEGEGSDSKSSSVSYGLLSTWHLDRDELLQEHLSANADKIRHDYGSQDFYPESETDIYRVVALEEDVQPLTTAGAALASMGVDVAQSMYQLRQWVAKMLRVFIAVGLVAIIGPWRPRTILPGEYQLMSVGGVIILGLGLILPVLSIEYGLLRLFQQLLAILAVPAVLGCLWLVSAFGRRVACRLTAVVSVFMFLLLSGFLPQVVGGYTPQFNLSNSGLYYDAYYTHDAEAAAMRWLADNRQGEASVQANMFAAAKMLTYARVEAFIGIAPGLLNRHSYIYLDRYNVERQADIAYVKGDMIRYSYPLDFLLDKKDLIYSNGQSMIFK